MDKGESQESLEEFLDMYFSRLAEFLGDGVVDPYVVLEREILAANPWEATPAMITPVPPGTSRPWKRRGRWCLPKSIQT